MYSESETYPQEQSVSDPDGTNAGEMNEQAADANEVSATGTDESGQAEIASDE